MAAQTFCWRLWSSNQAKGHELIEVDFAALESREESRARIGKPEPPLHNGSRDAEGCRDLLLTLLFVAQGGKGPEFIEGMQRRPFAVFGEAVSLNEAFGAYNAGHGLIFGELLLLYEHLQGAQRRRRPGRHTCRSPGRSHPAAA